MTRRARSIAPGTSCGVLWVLSLLLLAAELGAAPQDIDLRCTEVCPDCPMPPCPEPACTESPCAAGTCCMEPTCPMAPYTINATVGSEVGVSEIGVINASSDVFWDFAVAPAGCSGGPVSYNCNGIVITLPPGSPDAAVPHTDKVTLAGSPLSASDFTFHLQVSADLPGGVPTCSREYQLVVSQPFDIVFVLDRSGSMNRAADPAVPGVSRWDVLKDSVVDSLTLTGWVAELIAAPATSRFGLVLFSTTVDEISFPGLVDIDSDLPADVAAVLAGQSPGGLTAMGRGLQVGEEKMDVCTRPRVVVLFTDGEQNQPPEVLLSGTQYEEEDGDLVPVNATCPAGPQEVEIVSVGILQAGSSAISTLQALASSNGSNMIVTTAGVGTSLGTLEEAFDLALVPALSGNSPQITALHRGTLDDAVLLPAFDLNRQIDQMLIKLSFGRELRPGELAAVRQRLRVRREGSDVTSAFQMVSHRPDSLLLRGRFPLLEHGGPPLPPEGRYTLELAAGGTIPGNVGCRAIAFADDHRLGMDWSVNPAAPRVGQPFRPAVSLSWLGRPLTGATVQALVLKPGDDLGDLLAKNPFKVEPSSLPDADSPGLQKYQALLADATFVDRLLPVEQQLTLTHQGDGTYSASYDPGDISGVYQVFYRVSADDPTFGKVQRSGVQSVYVRFGTVDLPASAVSVQVGADATFINLRPKTTAGRFVGPANGNAFSVRGGGVRLSDVTDHQDGSYTLVLSGDPAAEVSVALLGEEIYRGPADGFGTRPSRFSLSLHAGLTDPQSGFAGAASGDLLAEVDLEVHLSPRFSLNAVLGRYGFDPEPDITGATLYVRGYLPQTGFRLFGELGAGFYDADQLDTSWGWSAGLGVDRPLTGPWRGEIGVDFFHLWNDGPDLELLAYKVGVRRAF